MNKNDAKQELVCRLAGVISGLTLAMPNFYPVLAPIQLLAFLPVFYLAAGLRVRQRCLLMAGVYMGLAYALPQMFMLRLPIPMTIILLAHFTVLLAVFACASKPLLAISPILGSFAAAAFFVVLDWINITVIPIWGTAQSFVRCWSGYPDLISFSSFTGMPGIVFIVASLQALAVNLIINPQRRLYLLIAIFITVLIPAAADFAISRTAPTDKITVAAAGWTLEDSAKCGEVYSPNGFEVLFAEPAARAAERGAKLIVFPELAFQFGGRSRGEWLEKFGQIARRHNIFLAIGYFNVDEEENRVLFMEPQGNVVAEYTKTYLTPFEDYNKGTGDLKIIDINGTPAGAMICQDDNFTRLSRWYGREGVQIVAVPTLDWRQVKDAHLQNSIHRAIESRYAIVRAALNGISAIISPTGKILASMDHFEQGPGVIIADVPLYSERTFFSTAGYWLVPSSFVFLAATVGWTKITYKNHFTKISELTRPLEDTSGEYPAAVRDYFKFYGLEADLGNVEHIFGTFESNGLTLAAHIYKPAQYKATVFIMHGYFDHCGQLNHLLKYLVEQGYAVAAFDLPGHGLSGGERGEIDDFRRYSQAMLDFCGEITPRLNPPYHFIGHSTGCAAVIDCLLTNRTVPFDRIILAAPLIHTAAWEETKLTCGKMPFMKTVPRVFRKNSSDAAFLKFIKYKDPLQSRTIPLNWVNALHEWNKQIADLQTCGKEVKIIQGSSDTTVDWRFNMDFLRAKFSNADVTIIENARHELFNESPEIRNEVFALISKYLGN